MSGMTEYGVLHLSVNHVHGTHRMPTRDYCSNRSVKPVRKIVPPAPQILSVTCDLARVLT